MSLPNNALKISLVTPNFNGADQLAQCLDSIAAQRYPQLEHVIVDGASTDNSMEIIDARRSRFAHLISEPDKGHADALNKGFAETTGEIMGWLNSDDMLHPGCLDTVARVFRAFPDVQWITGQASSMNLFGELKYVGPTRPWSRMRFLSGAPSWIQQESTFWRRSLWDAAGGRIDDSLLVANDFELWARFFRHAELHTVDRMLGCFRIRPGQRSVAQWRTYRHEADSVLARERSRLRPEERTQLESSQIDGPPQDAPPIITMASLRTKTETSQEWAHPRPTTSEHQLETMQSPVGISLKRNWRFIAALVATSSALTALAIVLESFRIWIALAAGNGVSIAITAVIALKTRRILSTMQQKLAEALAGRAEASLRNQAIELELDRLSEPVEPRPRPSPKGQLSDDPT